MQMSFSLNKTIDFGVSLRISESVCYSDIDSAVIQQLISVLTREKVHKT